jgi:hypothetical protein
MTKDKVISKNFYQTFYDIAKINKNILQIIFEEFLFNEYLNEEEKIKALITDFRYKIKYNIKKLYSDDTNILLDIINDYNSNNYNDNSNNYNDNSNNYKILSLNNNFSIAYFFKNINHTFLNMYNLYPELIYDYDYNYYNIDFFLFLDKKAYNIDYKKDYILYLKNIEQQLKDSYNNNINFDLTKDNFLRIIDTKFEYDFKYDNISLNTEYSDINFLRIKLSFKYVIKKNTQIDNSLNIFSLINYSNIKRDAKYENNNNVKQIIKCFKLNFIDNFIKYF